MNLDECQQIKAAHQSKAHLNQYACKQLLLQQQLILKAFEELYANLEDLEVAHEELCQQNSKLAAAHEVLVVERQRYQNIFNFAPDAYLVTDKYGTIREANRAAARLLNIRQHFLVGKPLVIFVCLEQRRAFRTELTQLHFCGYQRQEWEVRLQPRGGKTFDAKATVANVHPEGCSITLGWFIREITELKDKRVEALRH